MKKTIGIFSSSLMVSYPLWVYLTLTLQQDTRWLALVLLLVGGAQLTKFYLFGHSSRFLPSWFFIASNLAVVTLGIWVFVCRENFIFQLYPLLISATLFSIFSYSLLGQQSMIERFASLYEKKITIEKKLYMRRVTLVWCLFFLMNFGVSAYTWLVMSVGAWALYNGVISYLLIGLLFIVEYLYRRLVFYRRIQRT